MTSALTPEPGPKPVWTGLIKTRKGVQVDEKVPFPAGVTVIKNFKFTKRDSADVDKDRREFNGKLRGPWLESLANNPAGVAKLTAAGLTDADIADMREGLVPTGFQVHHKQPLDDGGTNTPSNYVLIRNDPYHIALTALHNSQCRDIPVGTTKTLDWPQPDGIVYPPTWPVAPMSTT
jgi:hypothetical protein